MNFPWNGRTTPVHSPTFARVSHERFLDGCCAGPDCWFQRLRNENLHQKKAVPQMLVYAYVGRTGRGWTDCRTPNYHRRLGEKTVLLLPELCSCCDLVDGLVRSFLDDLYLYHLMFVVQVLCC